MNKKKTWENLENKFRMMGDRLGRPLDGGIFETVVALNALQIATTSSCEGHLDHGLAAPWVDIHTVKDDAFYKLVEDAKALQNKAIDLIKTGQNTKGGQLMKKNQLLLLKLKKPNLILADRLSRLLEEFYLMREVPYSRRLIITSLGYGVRLKSQGEILQELKNKKVKDEKLKEYQLEMLDFTTFLKEKFFIE